MYLFIFLIKSGNYKVPDYLTKIYSNKKRCEEKVEHKQ